MSRDYDVGYGKPPVATRFKPGKSGNARGRPAGTRNLKTDLLDELSERITVKESGQSKTLSKQRALLKSLTAKAIGGDNRAATLLLNMLWRILEKEPPPEPEVDLSAEDAAVLELFARRTTAAGPPEAEGG